MGHRPSITTYGGQSSKEGLFRSIRSPQTSFQGQKPKKCRLKFKKNEGNPSASFFDREKGVRSVVMACSGDGTREETRRLKLLGG
ncbi:hypothetical protein V6Z11_A01G056800 [Gossypium hirsutum]